MKVKVTIFMSCSPSEQYFQNLEGAALTLSNSKKSVKIETSKNDKQHVVTVKFTMKTAPQYKVVDKIYREFRSAAWNISGYQDLSVEFSE